MKDKFEFDTARDAYVMTIEETGTHHRISVPLDMIADELGRDADEAAHFDFLRANFPQILQACMAKQSGGIVKAPWGRLMIEEIN